MNSKKTSSLRRLLMAGGLVGAMLPTAPAFACGETPYVGELCYFAFNFCPQGYLPANGASLPTQQNQALYSLMGTMYGGQGTTSFNLPNLVGRVPVNNSSYNPLPPAPLTRVPFGVSRGSAQVILNATNLPSHSHAATFSPTGGDTPLMGALTLTAAQANGARAVPQAGDILATLTDTTSPTPVPKKSYATAAQTGTLVPLGGVSSNLSGTGQVTVATAGAAAPLNITSPVLGMTACIGQRGLYPQRD